MRPPPVAGLLLVVTALATGCAGEPAPVPTIGSPTPSARSASPTPDKADRLATRWDLSGEDLPDDWPDVPVPRGSEVVSAYAVGKDPQRTWSGTFAADSGTALDLAEPVVAELRKRKYVPISKYVGPKGSNTGLFSFAAPTYAVYVVLGEDAGRPNIVITVRGTSQGDAGLPGSTNPTPAPGSPTAAPSPTASPTGSVRPSPESPTTRSQGSPSTTPSS